MSWDYRVVHTAEGFAIYEVYTMIECTDIFWQEFYKAAGITLGALVPLTLLWGGLILALFRQQQRHEARIQEARLRDEQARSSRYRQAS